MRLKSIARGEEEEKRKGNGNNACITGNNHPQSTNLRRWKGARAIPCQRLIGQDVWVLYVTWVGRAGRSSAN